MPLRILFLCIFWFLEIWLLRTKEEQNRDGAFKFLLISSKYWKFLLCKKVLIQRNLKKNVDDVNLVCWDPSSKKIVLKYKSLVIFTVEKYRYFIKPITTLIRRRFQIEEHTFVGTLKLLSVRSSINEKKVVGENDYFWNNFSKD